MSDIGPLEYLIHGKLGILKCIVLHMTNKMPLIGPLGYLINGKPGTHIPSVL